MDVLDQVKRYIASIPEPKQSEIKALHDLALQTAPGCRLWYSDGTNESGKVVSNPTIGYGSYTIRYANGSTKETFRVGLSANQKGISVYILGLDDKTYLSKNFSGSIGQADVTGYCIKFKSTQSIDMEVLKSAMKHAFGQPGAQDS